MRDHEGNRSARSTIETAHRERGASLQRSAATQRERASQAASQLSHSRSAGSSSVKADLRRRARRAEVIEGARMQHALLSASEIRGVVSL